MMYKNGKPLKMTVTKIYFEKCNNFSDKTLQFSRKSKKLDLNINFFPFYLQI